MPAKTEWFEVWFESPLYHILYDQRDDTEAMNFIHRLVAVLSEPNSDLVLDAACGNGRHSLTLSNLGFQVEGIDISEHNILLAKKRSIKNAHFFQGDLRELKIENRYRYIFNLFTSFGYFEKPEENLNVLKAFHNALKTDGKLVIDFFNAVPLYGMREQENSMSKSGVEFRIRKSVKDGFVVKEIDALEKNGAKHSFMEKVQLFTLEMFQKMFEQSGFSMEQCYGNYRLDPYIEQSSERLIMILKRL